MDPEDQNQYYESITRLIFGLEEEAELAMVVKVSIDTTHIGLAAHYSYEWTC